MASPPFSISTSVPGDSDIVSQFPILDRTLRDIIQSWILANHDTNGNHVILKMPYQGSPPPTPSAGIETVYADSVGRLKIIRPDATIHFVGTPPGNVGYTAASSVPVGWLVADGSAVSRSTYADLFAVIGTGYGAGDGSTTFNLPDINGRVVAGEDNSSGRLTASSGMTGVGRGATGGQQIHAISLAELPTGITSVTPGVISVGTQDVHSKIPATSGSISSLFAGGGTQNFPSSTAGGGDWVSVTELTTAAAVTVTSNNTSGNSIALVQPTIVLKAIIKT